MPVMSLLALMEPLLAADQPGRREFVVHGSQLLVGGIAASLSLLCVVFHYEVMSWTSRYVPRLKLAPRGRIVLMILAMLLAHVIEVWAFAIVYWSLDIYPSLGHLAGTFDEGALDFVYFSVVCFTTLGFGDILPTGAIRILVGTEALVGLGLVTWSASFAFLEMQRDWVEFHRGAPRNRQDRQK